VNNYSPLQNIKLFGGLTEKNLVRDPIEIHYKKTSDVLETSDV